MFNPACWGLDVFKKALNQPPPWKQKILKQKPPWILPTPLFFCHNNLVNPPATRWGEYPTLFGIRFRGHASAPDGSLRDGRKPFAPRQRGGGRGFEAAAEFPTHRRGWEGKFFPQNFGEFSVWESGQFPQNGQKKQWRCFFGDVFHKSPCIFEWQEGPPFLYNINGGETSKGDNRTQCIWGL